jgi:DNA-directed RNA polymerase beta subunit
LAEVINSINTGATATKFNTNRNSNDAKRNTVTSVLNKLDSIIFPHIGVSPDDRINKLKYLGFLINGIYGVKFGDEPSNRNSLANQVVSTTAMTLIMSFKSLFNITVVSKIIYSMQSSINTTDNPRGIMLKSAIESSMSNDLMKAISEAIKAGNRPKIKVNKQTTSNRVISNVLERTNKLASISVLRSMIATKVIGGKTNDAVTMSRNIHATTPGSNCMIKSVEGGSAGVVAETALSVEFSDIIYSGDIKKLIMEDPEVESIDKIDSGTNTYSRVIVNGNPICSHYNTASFAEKLRRIRRQGLIDRNTSIIYYPLKNGDLEVNTQKGRALRPFVIVYSNYDEFLANPSIGFRQWVNFTVEHSIALIEKKMVIQDLIDQEIIEMISPIEYRNILVAHSVEYFNTTVTDPTQRFTHLDLPLSNFGLSVLACPYINHSATVRTAYEGNQRKQTLGIPIFNYYSAFHKKLSLALNSFEPVTETIANRLVRTDGAPIIVAIMSGGNNQEDSLIMSENLTELGKFTINYYTTTSTNIEQNQSLGVPNPDTIELKSNDYSHLKDGIPTPGSIIRKGMPIIGIVERDSTDNSIRRDRSIIHKKNTTMIVDSFSRSHDSKGFRTISVKLHSVRPVESGDKFSSREGGKGINSKVVNIEHMPISESGLVAEALLNPHAFPSRMIGNQIMDGGREKLCAQLGVKMDCTVFSDPKEKEFVEALKSLKMENCTEVMYDDVTGHKIMNKIFIVPTLYQRLNKMIKDQSSAVDRPTIDTRTQQTTRGINSSGGTKFGEMEKDTQITNGAMEMTYRKMFKDCDKKTAYICNNCGNYAPVNQKAGVFKCIKCSKEQVQTTFTEMQSSFATFNLNTSLLIMGIGMKMTPTLSTF